MTKAPPHTPLDIDALIARVREEARRQEGASPPPGEAAGPGAHAPLSPLPDPVPRLLRSAAGEHHALSELLAVPEGEFVENAYRVVLGRAPDGHGLKAYKAYLAAGGNRSWVLASLLLSPEGQGRGVRIDGLEWVRAFRWLPAKRRLLGPLLGLGEKLAGALSPGYAVARDVAVLRRDLAAAHQDLRHALRARDALLEALAHRTGAVEETARGAAERLAVLEAGAGRLDARSGRLEAALAGVETSLAGVETSLAALQGLAPAVAALQGLSGSLTDTTSALRAHTDGLAERCAALEGRAEIVAARTAAVEKSTGAWERRWLAVESRTATLERHAGTLAIPEDDGSATGGSDVPVATRGQLDTYYLAFEDAFRGQDADIEASLGHYLADVRAAASVEAATPLLDLGCGRGEWLALLRKHGFPAAGIDSNAVMVDHCRERGLAVRRGDALAHLAGLPGGSLGAVSAFHIIEHLPFPVLYAFLEHAFRVLRPGGLLLLETPNPENVLVGSHTFYHDPTHRNPMTPTATSFLVRYFGFSEPQVRRLHPYPESAKVPGADPLTERVNGHLCGPQDFALIARKPDAAA